MPQGRFWTVFFGACAAGMAASGASFVFGSNWFGAVCFLAITALAGEAALRGLAAFRFGLAMALFALFWAVQAVAAAQRGDWFLVGLAAVCGLSGLASWAAPRFLR